MYKETLVYMQIKFIVSFINDTEIIKRSIMARVIFMIPYRQ